MVNKQIGGIRDVLAALAALALLLGCVFTASGRAKGSEGTTAWRNGQFNIDTAGVVGRSDIVLQRLNSRPEQAMPLGNGRLGVAVWSEGGFTAQLNRGDTFPARLSPGQISIPGLGDLVNAPDYAGRVDLYNGEFTEQGGGMKATAYVQPNLDVLVITVTGADPNTQETALLHLWAPREPATVCQNRICVISETWKDSTEAGASGKTFGSLAAITAQARDVTVQPQGRLVAKVCFRPNLDGTFRLLIASPEWKGGDALKTAMRMLSPNQELSPDEHRRWWNDFWKHAGLMKLSSKDNSAEYFENLRMIDLYTAAAESQDRFPGSQAGIGDLFSSVRDEHKWGPSAYWHWNLRMQVAANLGAGLYDLNRSYFNLYRDNLQNIEAWTKAQMDGRAGACVPETMRFNGQGYENETWTQSPGLNCSAASKPYYNVRTLTTGAEVSLWIWRQYLATRDRAFLAANYPVMAASARFLLAYAKLGAEGSLHTYPSNAHETQWDVHDPTPDIAAMKALFPALLQAARILKTDPALVREIESAIPRIRPFPRTDEAKPAKLFSPPDDATGADVIAQSYDVSAPVHNTENIGLEPIWPYDLIGDNGALHDLAVRTYTHRPNKVENDWSFDPIQAARLGLAAEVKSTLIQLTEKYQAYPSGLASFAGREFYVEQIGVAAAAMQEALVQDYDGVVQIAPAWPKDWDVDGTVYIQNRGRVHVQIRGGVPVTVAIDAGVSGRLRVRNPWPGQLVEVLRGDDANRIFEAKSAVSDLDFHVEGGQSYLIQRRGNPNMNLRFAVVGGTRATAPKRLGSRLIGIPKMQSQGRSLDPHFLRNTGGVLQAADPTGTHLAR
jgi:hypothetical protein